MIKINKLNVVNSLEDELIDSLFAVHLNIAHDVAKTAVACYNEYLYIFTEFAKRTNGASSYEIFTTDLKDSFKNNLVQKHSQFPIKFVHDGTMDRTVASYMNYKKHKIETNIGDVVMLNNALIIKGDPYKNYRNNHVFCSAIF